MIQLAAKQYLFREGDTPTGAYLIEEGRVQVLIACADGEKIIAVRGPGEIVGEMAIIDKGPRSASVKAIDNCVLLPVNAEQIANRMASADPVLRMVLSVILDRFRDTLTELGGQPATPAASNPFLVKAAAAELRLERELERALAANEVTFYYQPIVSLVSGRINGFEALARWIHPERGLILPAVFIAVAEISGQSAELARAAMRQVRAELVALNAAAMSNMASVEPPRININVSGFDVASADFITSLAEIAGRDALDAGLIQLELTETQLVRNLGASGDVLKAARANGFRLAIDDFGTGYSALNYIQALPVDTLKIDQSFVQGLADEDANRSILTSLLQLAGSLRLSLVAEGVETPEDAAILSELGCELGQGFLFGRARPLNETLELIRLWNAEGVKRMLAGPSPAERRVVA